MELFELPLENSTHLTTQLKNIAIQNGYSYKRFKRAVYKLLETDFGRVWQRRRKILRLLRIYGKADQRTNEWLQRRSEMITASEVTKAFKTASPSLRKELLQKKVAPNKNDGVMNTACTWGNQFEPIIKKIYGDLFDAEIVDTTCVRHPTYSFLGASPDGIVFTKKPSPNWGKLVEFKCPFSRKFTQESPIPDEYYHQMQMQMECTGLDECDYVEAQFKTTTQTLWRASSSPYKGVFAIYDNGTIDYMDNSVEFASWKKTLQGDEYRIIYWTLENLRITNVKKELGWIETHIGDLLEFWNIVKECRDDPSKTEHYMNQIGQRDVPSACPLETCENPVPSDGLSSGHKKTLRLEL